MARMARTQAEALAAFVVRVRTDWSHGGVMAAIERAADADPLDASTATYDVIRRQHPDIDRDAEVLLTPEQAAEFVAADLAQKAAEDRARLAKSTVLQAMERARIAKCGDRVVARRQPHKSGVSLVRVAAKKWRAKVVAELVAAGLLEDEEDHWSLHDYLDFNRSSEEIEASRESRGVAGTLGNHMRWHVARRAWSKDCEHCIEGGRIAIAN